MKDECGGRPIAEFIGLRPKMYSILSAMRAGPFELEAGPNFDEFVGRVSEDDLEEDC